MREDDTIMRWELKYDPGFVNATTTDNGGDEDNTAVSGSGRREAVNEEGRVVYHSGRGVNGTA